MNWIGRGKFPTDSYRFLEEVLLPSRQCGCRLASKSFAIQAPQKSRWALRLPPTQSRWLRQASVFQYWTLCMRHVAHLATTATARYVRRASLAAVFEETLRLRPSSIFPILTHSVCKRCGCRPARQKLAQHRPSTYAVHRQEWKWPRYRWSRLILLARPPLVWFRPGTRKGSLT